jgi:hypothetical protein
MQAKYALRKVSKADEDRAILEIRHCVVAVHKSFLLIYD